MEHSYRFFSNKACEFYPCHKGVKDLNCLFCYCPFYLEASCPGKPFYLEDKGKTIKDCSACTFPHHPGNYDVIIDWIIQANQTRRFAEQAEAQAQTA
ncbi:MAG: metal-binding protein [Eubacterium sp.]|nr:metal-binding protein [Eubacterium sp.]